MIRLECEYCGSEFEAERSSAKYCCDSHKTLASRERKHDEEVEYERQLQQAELNERRSRIEENLKRQEKQAAAELAERRQIAANEQKAYKEQQTKKAELRRQKEKDRRRVEEKKRNEKADLDFKLIGLGVISVLGLANLFFNHNPKLSNNNNKPDDKQSDSLNPNKMPDNQYSDIKSNTESISS